MARTSDQLAAGSSIPRDLTAGLVVFLVALPLCLGIALASGAPLISGVLSGIIGGILVGALSGSQTSVSGPAAGLTAIISFQLVKLGSFQALLLAVVIAGLLQMVLGVVRAGNLSAFVPTSVINGLLAAIGVILILKQIPHLLGHDTDPEGEMSFAQPDHETTLSEFARLFGDLHPGAALIGIVSLVFLIAWDRFPSLKKSLFPAPLVVVGLGVSAAALFASWGAPWGIEGSHLVQVPVADNFRDFLTFLQRPDFSQWANPAVLLAGLTIAVVASLETLLNVEAVDKLDPRKRQTPPNQELVAQGIGNVVAGLIGGLPMTSVVVRSSVNLNAGARTKLSAIFHGVLLLICVVWLPTYLNRIPLSCLAAILLSTGIKLASPALFQRMYQAGRYQFAPFLITLVAIIFTDLLIGILIGLAVSLAFVLNSNLRRPIRRIVEQHLGGEVVRIELANQVSFLNRASLEATLRSVAAGGHVMIDASNTHYIDPDILNLIRDFRDETAPAHGVRVSLKGFRDKYQLVDEIQYVDYSTRELQEALTAAQVLEILREGNERFRNGRRLTRDLGQQVNATAGGQHPMAVVLSCIDSRSPAELIFDLGIGDIFSVRVAGNVTSPKVLGSIEYSCAVAGAKLVLVLGHTRCGAVTSTLSLSRSNLSVAQATGCRNLQEIVDEIRESLRALDGKQQAALAHEAISPELVDLVAEHNVIRSVRLIVEQSSTIRELVEQGRAAVVGAMYDVATGQIRFLEHEALGLPGHPGDVSHLKHRPAAT